MHVMSAEKDKDRRPAGAKEIYSQLDRGEVEPAKAVWLVRKKLTWKDWLVVDFLRYWYLVGVLAFEAFLGLELIIDLHIGGFLGSLFVIAALSAIAYLAFRFYRYLWPEGALTRLEERPPLRRKKKRRRFEG